MASSIEEVNAYWQAQIEEAIAKREETRKAYLDAVNVLTHIPKSTQPELYEAQRAEIARLAEAKADARVWERNLKQNKLRNPTYYPDHYLPDSEKIIHSEDFVERAEKRKAFKKLGDPDYDLRKPVGKKSKAIEELEAILNGDGSADTGSKKRIPSGKGRMAQGGSRSG